MFWEIYKEFSAGEIYFAELNPITKMKDLTGKNNEYTLKVKLKALKPDFIVLNAKKIIEFDGTYWHDNQQNPLREKERDDCLESSGYLVIHIKENDYKNDKQGTIQKCLNFLKQ